MTNTSLCLHICITSSTSIHLSVGTQVASISWLLWIMLPQPYGYMYLFKLVFLFYSEKYPGVGLLLSILFNIVPAPNYSPTKSARGFPFFYILTSQEAFNKRLPVCCLDLSGTLWPLLIPEYSGIKRRGMPFPGLRNPGISHYSDKYSLPFDEPNGKRWFFATLSLW